MEDSPKMYGNTGDFPSFSFTMGTTDLGQLNQCYFTAKIFTHLDSLFHRGNYIFLVKYIVHFSVHFDSSENWLGGQIGNNNICEL
jgi:hypothetical protein